MIHEGELQNIKEEDKEFDKSEGGDEENTSQKTWKVMLLGGVVIAGNVTSIYALSKFFEAGTPLSAYVSAGAILVALIGMVILVMGTRNALKLHAVTFLTAIVPLVIFYEYVKHPAFMVVMAGALVNFFFLRKAIKQGGVTLDNSLKVNFFSVSRPVVRNAVTGFLIMVCGLMYGEYLGWGKLNDALAEKFIRHTLKSGEGIIRVWYPTVSFEEPIGKIIERITETEVVKAKFPVSALGIPGIDTEISLELLPLEVKNEVIKRANQELTKNMQKIIGPFDENERIEEVIYRYMKEQIRKIPEKVKTGFMVAVLFVVFSAMKGIAALLYWLVEGIGFVVFKTLIAAGFLAIRLETRKQEVVVLS